ncbi:aminoglycoside phosphotransferase family protein [Amnibacterium sp. CER49]|uniref:aminoglycoside phosphotransferase family protein n=1 Tax=Amnibacterium sp. CER49 TaxID=3039161 RepID=UPI00244B1912|nr:aminoglycoside phosphotransferase family protein [Amnibacterium sp. CER49]MDH2445143.1 aminoglycoside phosphotransferase family protein [Amnibacterium sp. CER49]
MTDEGQHAAVLAALLRAWQVEPVADTLRTPSSLLVAGVRDGVPVMLKVPLVEEERVGCRLLEWWGGRGAVPVLERDDDAVLMLRATGGRSLVAMATDGQDATATAVLVDAAASLHAHGLPPEDLGLVPLGVWFRDLIDEDHQDPLLTRASAVAREVLEATREEDVVALHGDLHHDNVLDLGDGWAAIDPKGLVGHRAFDFANVFCNPDEQTALAHLEQRLEAIAAQAGLEKALLAAWVVAWCGLSLAWTTDEPGWHDRAARGVAELLLRRHLA